MVGELEATLEGARGDALVEDVVRSLAVRLLLAADGEGVLLRLDRELLAGEARHRKGDAVGVLAGALDVVGRVSRRRVHAPERIEERKQAVVADGGTVEGSEIERRHGISSLKRHVDAPPKPGRLSSRSPVGPARAPYG